MGALREGAVYTGDNGRFMCAATHCAGSTAHHTGRDLSGQKVQRVSVDDVAEWATYDLGPLTCACGAVSLVALSDSDAWPIAR